MGTLQRKDKNRVLIIAEAGVNHNGSLKRALKLIDKAAECGADIIKFQTFKTENLVSRKAPIAKYKKKNSSELITNQFDLLKKLEIPRSWYDLLIERCNTKKIGFLSTAFDKDSIDLLEKIGIPFYKIPSGEITNKPYLEYVSKKGKNVILSTGMSSIDEIQNAIQVLTLNGLKKTKLQFCNVILNIRPQLKMLILELLID